MSALRAHEEEAQGAAAGMGADDRPDVVRPDIRDAEALVKETQEAFPNCEVELNDGGQPIYYYLLSVE